MDTPIPEFLAEAANRRVSDIFIIAGRPLAEKIDGHLLDRGDRLMPDQTENLLRTIYGLAENRDPVLWKPVMMTFLFPFPVFPDFVSMPTSSVVPWLP